MGFIEILDIKNMGIDTKIILLGDLEVILLAIEAVRTPAGRHFENGGKVHDDPNFITAAYDFRILRTLMNIFDHVSVNPGGVHTNPPGPTE